MILTAYAGRTKTKVTIDADHPFVSTVARTNLAPNPSLHYGLTPWMASGQATISVETLNGNEQCKVVPNGVSPESAAYPVGPSGTTFARLGWKPGDMFTASAYIYRPAPQTSDNLSPFARCITVGFLHADGSQTYADFASNPAPNTVGSTRLSLTFTIPDDATGINLRLMNGSDTATDVVYWDGLLIERGPLLRTSFPGDFADTATEDYAWTGTPGNSASTQTVKHSPLVSDGATPVQVRLLGGNFHGPYSTSDTSRMNQAPAQIALILASGCDLVATTELHEENDMHRLFLGQLQQQDADWDLAEGDGGNQLLYRPSVWSVSRVVNVMMPGSRSMSDFTIRDRATGFELHVLDTHTRADDSDGKSRRAERQAQVTFVAQYAAPLKYVVVAGDWNFETSQIASLRAILAGAGLVGLQTREPNLPNSDKDSYSGASTGRWIDDIFTRTAQPVAGSAGIVAGNASDHYLWVKASVVFVVGSPNPAYRMTLWRDTVDGRTAVPGMVNVTARTMVVTDHACPLGRDVSYVVTMTDGTTTVAAPVQLGSDLPLLTHPITGQTAPAVIQTWPERSAETPATLIKIPGRRSPVVLLDVEGLPSSTPVLLTRTREEERGVDSALKPGEVLLLRTLTPKIPDAYLAVTARRVSRVAEFRAESEARLHELTAQEVDGPTQLGIGETLGDLAAALPGGTLRALAALFPGGTLLDIAAYEWATD